MGCNWHTLYINAPTETPPFPPRRKPVGKYNLNDAPPLQLHITRRHSTQNPYTTRKTHTTQTIARNSWDHTMILHEMTHPPKRKEHVCVTNNEPTDKKQDLRKLNCHRKMNAHESWQDIRHKYIRKKKYTLLIENTWKPALEKQEGGILPDWMERSKVFSGYENPIFESHTTRIGCA